jgi:D-alanine-D-alanine ligase
MDVAVLVGGRSPEHDVSLASAAQVLRHLDRRRFRVWPVYLDRHGGWWPDREPLPRGADWQPMANAPAVVARPGAALDWLLDEARVQVVFPVLHGPHGEDGTLQGMLELYGVPFVGSGCAASAVAMDKLRTRQAYVAGQIPVPPIYQPSVAIGDADAATELAAIEHHVGLPAFVKVDASGSTVGVQRITGSAELAEFFVSFRTGFRRWFAEGSVRGEEITVAVLGNCGGRLEALPPVGIYPRSDDWFTHDAKYRAGACDEVVPPRGLSAAAIDEVQALAVRCHELLVCDGMSRTDMIVSADGPIVLETNTIPGLTGLSLLPQAAKAAGLPFPQLLERLLDLALARAASTRPAAVAGT